MTKSDIVIRDIDLFRYFEDRIVAISLSIPDEKLRKQLEPSPFSVEARINALKKLHNAGIKTALFVSPIFPYLTDWKRIFKRE